MKKWYVTFLAVILVSCTDYVSQIEDEREDWRNAQELAALSSSSVIVKSSGSEKSNSSSSGIILSSENKEETSSSSVKSSDSSSISSESQESSSSEEIVSSSSSKKDEISSSSEKVVSSSSGKASWAYLNPAISYGEMTDSRDGQVYKTVVIGEQTWMAENLNFKTEDSYCYNDSTKYCDKYGRLYTWEDAKKACPEDWHLPTKAEYDVLISTVGDSSFAGKMLKSTSVWDSNWNGLDEYGFSALPAGLKTSSRYSHGEFYGYLLSSTQYNAGHVYYLLLRYGFNDAIMYPGDMIAGSVRCLKNKIELPKSSSSISSSSSSKASWAYLNPAISYGEMTDDRDGQVYKTVEIGEQTWMAENMNLDAANSFCYNDSASNCAKYGRLYTWAAALDACPTDWHLPDSTEWNYLIDITGGELEAGTSLKSIRASSDAVIDNGSDEYGFSAVAAGSFENNSAYRDLNTLAYFWSSSERSTTVARMLELSYRFSNAVLGGEAKSVAISVRCLKNGNEIPKSSSSISSSSSSKASWAYLNPSYSYGEMTDDRDGQVYKTVEIGEQTWMAENLNYETTKSFCKNCNVYGRLYLWSAAMDSAGTWSTNGKGCGYDANCTTKYPVRGVCPSGWHLPATGDWNKLITAIGGQYATVDRLKSTSGWSDSIGNGNDAISFSAIPAGRWDGSVDGVGEYTYFWSSTMTYGSRNAYRLYVGENNVIAQMNYSDMRYGYSVRCIKD